MCWLVMELISFLHICSDFYVWTFVYDVLGIDTVAFYYRKDLDGANPIDDIANEVYRSGEPVFQP